MVDRYYRKIEDVENDIENAMQISNILLKLKRYDDDLGKIDTNENNISTNSGLISTNTGDISTNSGLISTNTGDISTNSGLISTNTGDIASNLSKINNIENDMKLSNEYNETFVIPHKSSNNWDVGTIFDKTIKFKFTSNGIIKINAIYNYIYDTKYNFKHVYRFYYNQTAFFNRTELYHNRISNIVTDEFEVQSIDISEIRLKIYLIANGDSQQFKLNDNSIQIMYNETNLKSDINKNNIESNLEKINDNSSSIESNSEKINDLQNSNVKAFYNLDKIFIYDIEKGYQTVNKDNHYHIFEREITYDFTKNSYLEIILKVLTEVSNYVLIGYFQILCNFNDQDNNLFYTISLSTAAGSINKLSTVKSVFIVPINKNMSKIKIDFFIAPKATQQNRSAKFVIQDISSNKIYIKYFQKTNEMSIKDIQDSLNTVNNFASKIDNLEKSIYLKNLFNELYHENDVPIGHMFFEKSYTINAKQNDFIEIYFKLLIKYDDVSNAKHITTNFILYDGDLELNSCSYDNSDCISNSNTDILLQNTFSYHFNKDVNKLKIIISFTKRRSYVKISYSSINNNRLIIKHYGN